MKTLWLIPLSGVLLASISWSSVQAQVYGARRMVNRRLPNQVQPPVYPQRAASTNAAPQTTTAPELAAPTAPTTPATTSPTVRTQVVVRYVPPPVDPEKVKAAKAEALRKTVEFQKKRASEGSESAQYELGLRYLKGDGVDKDPAEGRKWLALSAKNGYIPATKKLTELDKAPTVPDSDEPKPVKSDSKVEQK